MYNSKLHIKKFNACTLSTELFSRDSWCWLSYILRSTSGQLKVIFCWQWNLNSIFVQQNQVDAVNELRSKYPSEGQKCPMEECGRDTIEESEYRLCRWDAEIKCFNIEMILLFRACYQQFLSAFIWYRGIEPW